MHHQHFALGTIEKFELVSDTQSSARFLTTASGKN